MTGSTKYIFVTGGVTSSLGTGIVSASLAKLLQARGFTVTIQKLDPYINVDPGTMSPYQHGEVYVLDDGAETDLDLGLTKTWKFSERQMVQADLSVTNAYDRRNIFYFDRVTASRQDQLPLLPSVGLSWTF